MTRIYSVACIQRVRLKGSDDGKVEAREVERAVNKIVSVDGYAEDAIAKTKKLVDAEASQDDRDILGLDVVNVTLQNVAE